MEIFLIIDESGSKTNSNKQENTTKEFGLMAGILLFKEGYEFFQSEAKKIISKLAIETTKTHLTDIPKESRKVLTKDFFDFFSENPIPWLYTSIYTQGFYEFHNSTIKDKNNPKNFSMHTTLFKTNLLKLIAFIKDNYPEDCKEIKLTVVTDNISSGIEKGFYKEFNDLKPYFLHGQKESTVKVYRECEPLETYQFTVSLDEKVSSEMQCNSISLDIIIDNDAAFFADILNNTLYNHIKNHIKLRNIDEEIHLNSKEAIQDYQLFNTCYGYSTDTNPSFTDLAYSYKEKKQD